MSAELKERLKRIVCEKQIIEMQIQELELLQAKEDFEGELNNKRKSIRIAESSRRKVVKTSAVDNIKITGLEGTLGSNLIKLGATITVGNKKNQYFSSLSKNSIIDITNNKKSSQIDLLGGKFIDSFLMNYKFDMVETYLLNPPFLFNKIDGSRTLKKKYEEIDIYRPLNQKGVILKKISVHILYQIACKPPTDNYLRKCSEQTLLIRYWSNLFEFYFGFRDKMFLQWGDTVSLSCKKSNLMFKLDIRLIAEKDDEFDVVNGEVASFSGSNRGKYYKDSLKLALSAKQHLNHIVSLLPSLTPKEIYKIKVPIIQIMGFNLHISCLSIVDKNIYVLQDLYSFNYPKTSKEIQEGAIERIMTGFLLIDNMINDLDDVYNSYSNVTNDKIEIIKNEKKPKKKSNLCDEYLSAVEWNSFSTDDEDGNIDDDIDEED